MLVVLARGGSARRRKSSRKNVVSRLPQAQVLDAVVPPENLGNLSGQDDTAPLDADDGCLGKVFVVFHNLAHKTLQGYMELPAGYDLLLHTHAWIFDGIKLVLIGRLGKFFGFSGSEKDFSFPDCFVRCISIIFAFPCT